MRLHLLRKFPWSIAIAIGAMLFFASRTEWMLDLRGMRDAENTLSYYHPLWARWLFSALSVLPLQVTFLLLSLLTLAALLFALRVFGGRHWMVFLSYQLFWIFFYGQIDGLIIGGLALAYWAVERKRPYLIGLGLAVAMVKPQMSAFLMLLFWWWSPSRWKTLLPPVGVALLSFLQWGFWVPDWVGRLFGFQEIFLPTATNISLWPILEAWGLLLWPIVFLLKLGRPRKILAVAAATMITVPYFPVYSSLLVLPMQMPVLPFLLLQSPFLLPVLGAEVFDWLRAVPVLLLGWAAFPALEWRKNTQDAARSESL